MSNKGDKKQVQVYLVPELHKELKKLAAERDLTISHLIELAVREKYRFEGLLASEAPTPYGREREPESARKAMRPTRPK